MINDAQAAKRMTPPLRIGQIIINLETGGAQAIVMELMRLLDRQRFEPVLISLGQSNHYEDEIRREGWKAKRVSMGRRYPNADIRALSAYFKEQSIDLVHCHATFAKTAGRAAAIHAGVPGMIGHWHNINAEKHSREFLETERFLNQYTDSLVACSREVSTYVEENIELSGAPIKMIPNAIDLNPYDEASSHRARCRRELGVSNGAFHIVHTARLEPRKQPELLLKALSLSTVKKDRCLGDWRLTFVGGGSLRDELDRVIGRLDEEAVSQGGERIAGRVHFPGWSRQIPQWLASADVYTLMSYSEGFSLSTLEAMAAGTPVVSTDIIGPREFVHHEQNGLMVDPHDEHSVLEALYRIRTEEDLRNRLVKEARKTARQYGIREHVEKTQDLYESVWEQPAKTRDLPSSFLGREKFLFQFQQHIRAQRRAARRMRKAGKLSAAEA